MSAEPTQPPENGAYKRSGTATDRHGPVTSVTGPPGPPPYRADRAAPRTENRTAWLADKIDNGRRGARPRPCPRCGADTLVGPDHDTAALTARVEVEPVDRVGEVAALLAGRDSYDLDRGALCHRWPEHHHSPRRPHPVHVTHRCPRSNP